MSPPLSTAARRRGVCAPISRAVSPTTLRTAVRSGITLPQFVERGFYRRAVHLVHVEAHAGRADHRDREPPAEVLAKLLQAVEHVLPPARPADLLHRRKQLET